MVLCLTHDHYARLEATARTRGFQSVEQLVASWQARERDRAGRITAARHVNLLRERLSEIYGELPDSTPLVQQDRAR